MKIGFNIVLDTPEIKEAIRRVEATLKGEVNIDEYNMHRAELCKSYLGAWCDQEIQFNLDGLEAASEFIHYTAKLHQYFELQETVYSLGSFYGHILKLHFNGEWSEASKSVYLPYYHILTVPDLISLEPVRSVDVSYYRGEKSSLVNQFKALNDLHIAQVGIEPNSQNRIC